jgi:uncharacterized protein (DUF1501 family)
MRGRTATPPTIPDDRGFTLAHASRQIAKERDALVAEVRGGEGDLAFLRRTARISYDAAERMSEITREASAIEYPKTPLGRELQLVAQLIRGGFGTRVFQVALGGFDTHASQASVHGARMKVLDGALTAFQRDLAAGECADDVVTMVFSEFGRRAAENGSQGTDHGKGNPVLFLGPSTVGGHVGSRPDLGALEDGDVPSTLDFRGLYRQLEEGWMGLQRFAREEITAPPVLRAGPR